MKVSDLENILNARCVQAEYEDREIAGAYTTDLLSDAMANAVDDGVLITIQAHKNTVAVATLKDLAAIIICNNRSIPDDMTESARSEGIALFVTEENQFTVSGKLFRELMTEHDNKG
ncbi:hypothetical protein K7I13_10475 [Brucepastera parasyntrophica]|uniref:hypothetical protein n=1 Tax=Brucepastera parasyntrophica TaxID=2880008 RepID=UPI00210EBFF7|nr:hypothetical protein [Brucepastera parasyntrophica]ULQ58942.1 hypothetical protein K7I13_10475 [Brucepastera parasyntrophica]